ncbi:MAG TPA: dienelactone hydrolase family protein [Chitinophagaceae bacterium]|jgi:phospholipase/carboxylesterase|nr:dienelactone hydrolase family protein [Chitinophagaceae bacterium]
MHQKRIITAGKPLEGAGKVNIMLHGRGARADDILSLSAYLKLKDFALVAPEATNNTWYPYSFMSPPSRNEPWLSSALAVLKEVVADINNQGIPSENIFFTGFSQGACLLLEFITRNAKKYGGAVAFTGGLIGDKIYPQNYSGDFDRTPVFIGTSNPDPHIPVERVFATANIMKNMNADVTEKVYNDMGHTINEDEINQANKLIFSPVVV